MKEHNGTYNVSEKKKIEIFNNSHDISDYVEPPAVKIGLKEVWIVKDDCGHEPDIFIDREDAYAYIKMCTEKNYKPFQCAEDEIEYNTAIKELDEEYSDGDNFFGVDGFMYARCYKVHPKGEIPEW